jgi:hypothetical protein
LLVVGVRVEDLFGLSGVLFFLLGEFLNELDFLSVGQALIDLLLFEGRRVGCSVIGELLSFGKND